MSKILRSFPVTHGMSLLYLRHRSPFVISLARVELCRRGETQNCNIFIKKLFGAYGDDEISEATLDENDISDPSCPAMRLTYECAATGVEIQTAALQAMSIENKMLKGGWEVFDRKRAQKEDGLETLQRSLGILRFIPLCPVSEYQYIPPVNGLGEG